MKCGLGLSILRDFRLWCCSLGFSVSQGTEVSQMWDADSPLGTCSQTEPILRGVTRLERNPQV